MQLTIIICTRNRAAQLGGTLRSIQALVTGKQWEALIVDNASTDDTAQVVAQASAIEPRIRYIREDRIGLGAARDRGWREAKGEILSFTDDDCYLESDYVDAVLGVFAAYPDVGFVGGRILLYDPADLPITIETRAFPVEIEPRTFIYAAAVHGANLSFRKEALAKGGGFDPMLGAGTPFPCEDIDAAAGVLWAGYPGRYDPVPTLYHHHGRKTADRPRLMAGYDRGRGAYYAKYLLRPDTRLTYLRGWVSTLSREPLPGVIPRSLRELRSALAYWRTVKGTPFAAAMLPVGAVGWIAAMLYSSVRRFTLSKP